MKRVHKVLNIVRPLVLVLAIVAGAPGCKKFVQIGPPTTQLATNAVFNNRDAATSAQLSIYIAMWQLESFNMAVSTGLMGDELVSASSSALYKAYYQNGLSSLLGAGPWTSGYQYIYDANSVIEKLQNNGNIAAPIAAQLIGESKFVRAWWHFYLTNLYGDIPLVLTTDYTVNGKAARMPQPQVYQQIIADLKDAAAYLNSNYVDATDTAITTERVRPTKGAAAAMLARVYLYTKKYDSAEAQANLVINSSMYSLCTKLTGAGSVFQRNSTEAIWQLATPVPNSYATIDGTIFYLKVAPSTGTTGFTSINQPLLNAFEPNDKRFTQWLGVYQATASSPKYYYPYKYQSNVYNTSSISASNPAPEYVMMLRLAEQYLIRAEARAQQSNLTGALSDLNMIRTRAGLPNYAGNSDQTSILNAILRERQVELFTEWGSRWFDMKRVGILDAVMGGSTGVCQAKGGVWSSTQSLLPIATTEIVADPTLSQNPGY